MPRLFVSVSAVCLALAACTDAPSGAPEPAPRLAFVGTWAADAQWCANTAMTTDRVPVRISETRFEGYENSCDIIALDETGEGWDAQMICMAEGMEYRHTVRMVADGDTLRLTYLERGTDPIMLVRCD
ncbi:MAG: hypothetical protein ACK4E3_02055 [Brevundimonas sp.]|jgi:hypothetical protein|uniref:hypothetical protein n=1 Tax=Brevundimonas sp. TaxID=1871086 RepID=UPI003919307D